MSLSRLRWHRHVLWALCITYPAALFAQAPAADAGATADDPEKRKEEAKVRFQRGLELKKQATAGGARPAAAKPGAPADKPGPAVKPADAPKPVKKPQVETGMDEFK